jgi:hypothetical protein
VFTAVPTFLSDALVDRRIPDFAHETLSLALSLAVSAAARDVLIAAKLLRAI